MTCIRDLVQSHLCSRETLGASDFPARLGLHGDLLTYRWVIGRGDSESAHAFSVLPADSRGQWHTILHQK